MVAPTVNAIYDSRKFERLEPLIQEFHNQGISYKIWDAINVENVVTSINLSHKAIIADAKAKGLPMVTVCEDDLYFPSLNGWKYYVDNMPKSFDLYLGCTFIPPISNNKVCGFHLYTVHENFYDKFLSAPEDQHIDVAMDDLKGNYVFCYPFPALQRPGYSFNNPGAIVNYNSVLQEQDIYK